MTVSFFLKRSNNRRQSIRDAITYGNKHNCDLCWIRISYNTHLWR
jgi:hypothetical protein